MGEWPAEAPRQQASGGTSSGCSAAMNSQQGQWHSRSKGSTSSKGRCIACKHAAWRAMPACSLDQPPSFGPCRCHAAPSDWCTHCPVTATPVSWPHQHHTKHTTQHNTTQPSPQTHASASPGTQVLPALDPATPVYAGSFVMKLVERRAAEFSLFDPARFRVMDMRRRFQAGPFE